MKISCLRFAAAPSFFEIAHRENNWEARDVKRVKEGENWENAEKNFKIWFGAFYIILYAISAERVSIGCERSRQYLSKWSFLHTIALKRDGIKLWLKKMRKLIEMEIKGLFELNL